MVVNYFDDPDRGDFGLIEATARLFGERLVVGREEEARGASKVEGVLPGAVRSKGVQATGKTAHSSERRCGTKHRKPTPKNFPLHGTEASDARAIRRALLRELPVGPGNVNR